MLLASSVYTIYRVSGTAFEETTISAIVPPERKQSYRVSRVYYIIPDIVVKVDTTIISHRVTCEEAPFIWVIVAMNQQLEAGFGISVVTALGIVISGRIATVIRAQSRSEGVQ